MWRHYESSDGPGYVYLVRHPDGRHKIGCTCRWLRDRIGGLCYHYQAELELVHFIPSEHPRAVECHLHLRYEAKHLGHEWFDLTAEEVAEIRAMTHEDARSMLTEWQRADARPKEPIESLMKQLVDKFIQTATGSCRSPGKGRKKWKAIAGVAAALGVSTDVFRDKE